MRSLESLIKECKKYSESGLYNYLRASLEEMSHLNLKEQSSKDLRALTELLEKIETLNSSQNVWHLTRRGIERAINKIRENLKN